MRLVRPAETFDMVKFDLDHPVFDPFVERLNERERDDSDHCWGCHCTFDKSGKRVGDADPDCEEISSHRFICSSCKTFLSNTGFIF